MDHNQSNSQFWDCFETPMGESKEGVAVAAHGSDSRRPVKTVVPGNSCHQRCTVFINAWGSDILSRETLLESGVSFQPHAAVSDREMWRDGRTVLSLWLLSHVHWTLSIQETMSVKAVSVDARCFFKPLTCHNYGKLFNCAKPPLLLVTTL